MPFSNNGIEIFYSQVGKGEPILFCHGAGGNSAIWWQQAGVFSQTHRCITFDHRGFGRSSCTVDQFDVTKYADDALSILDHLQIEKAHIVCQSMGGWTGVNLALHYPDRVKSLVLSNTIGGFALPSGLINMNEVIGQIQNVGGSNVALGKRFRLNDPVGAFLYREISAFNTRIKSFDLYGHMFRDDVLVDLERGGEISVPVLIIAGKEDGFWSPEILRELSGHLPTSHVVEIDAGHSPYYETPKLFNFELYRFLGTV